MDSKSNGNKVWVTKLRHDIRIRELDEALSRHRLRAEEIRLLPRGRAVLIFDQQSGKNATTLLATSLVSAMPKTRNIRLRSTIKCPESQSVHHSGYTPHPVSNVSLKKLQRRDGQSDLYPIKGSYPNTWLSIYVHGSSCKHQTYNEPRATIMFDSSTCYGTCYS